MPGRWVDLPEEVGGLTWIVWHFELDEQAEDRKSSAVGIVVGLFFLIALCYASAGFGGGSSYTALLLFQGEDQEVIRTVSLACNLVVAGIGGWMSLRAQRVNAKLLWPLLMSSIPAVWLGTLLQVEGETFEVVLGSALLIAGGLLLFQQRECENVSEVRLPILLSLGAGLGLLAGVTGIGGGIYLIPALHLLRAGSPKEIAAVGTWFIIVNSTVGLGSVMMSHGAQPLMDFRWLPLSVATGGLIGARLLQGFFNGMWVRRVTGILVLSVAGRVILSFA